MLAAYFDDTGKTAGNESVIGAFGLISTTEKWTDFETAWRGVLSDFELPFLHMKDLRSYRGHYAKFGDDRSLEIDLHRRVQETIEASAEVSIGYFLTRELYDGANQRFMLEEHIGQAFTLSALFSIKDGLQWRNMVHRNEEIEFVFDLGTEGWGRTVSLARREYDVVPVQADKKKRLPLQASDYIAWECQRFATTVWLPPNRDPIRQSFHAMMRRLGGDRWFGMTNKDSFMAHCLEAGIPERS